MGVRKRMNCKPSLLVAVCVMLAATNLPAQFVEVEAAIEVTQWNHQDDLGLSLKTSRSFSARCVVGTNIWFIENNSRTNYQESAWFVNGKIIRLLTSTQDSASEEPDYFSVRRGGRSANVTRSDDGYPAGDLSVNLPWFAFCSGPYLQRPGRSVPLPAASTDRPAFGFKDETTLFSDRLGLPRRVALYTSKQELKAEYRVQQFTNVLGWNFPMAFTVVQNEPGEFNELRRQLAATGRVTSIRRGSKPELPAEIQARLEMLERYPSRRR